MIHGPLTILNYVLLNYQDGMVWYGQRFSPFCGATDTPVLDFW